MQEVARQMNGRICTCGRDGSAMEAGGPPWPCIPAWHLQIHMPASTFGKASTSSWYIA